MGALEHMTWGLCVYYFRSCKENLLSLKGVCIPYGSMYLPPSFISQPTLLHFRASTSVEQWIKCSSETSIDVFSGFETVKGSVGLPAFIPSVSSDPSKELVKWKSNGKLGLGILFSSTDPEMFSYFFFNCVRLLQKRERELEKRIEEKGTKCLCFLLGFRPDWPSFWFRASRSGDRRELCSSQKWTDRPGCSVLHGGSKQSGLTQEFYYNPATEKKMKTFRELQLNWIILGRKIAPGSNNVIFCSYLCNIEENARSKRRIRMLHISAWACCSQLENAFEWIVPINYSGKSTDLTSDGLGLHNVGLFQFLGGYQKY